MSPISKIALLAGGFIAMAVPFDCFAGETDVLLPEHRRGGERLNPTVKGSIPPSRLTRNDDRKRGGRTAGIRTGRGGSGSGGNQGGGQGSGQGGSGK